MNSIAAMRSILVSFLELKAQLEKFEQKLKPLGNYEKRLLDGKIPLADAPLKTLVPFFISMRKATQALQKMEGQNDFTVASLPPDIATLYTSIRDTIYRSGKYENGGMNRNNDGLTIKADCVFLGNPPGTFRRNLKWILSKWTLHTVSKPEAAQGYSIEAWLKIKNNFELITKIDKFKTKLDKVSY